MLSFISSGLLKIAENLVKFKLTFMIKLNLNHTYKQTLYRQL